MTAWTTLPELGPQVVQVQTLNSSVWLGLPTCPCFMARSNSGSLWGKVAVGLPDSKTGNSLQAGLLFGGISKGFSHDASGVAEAADSGSSQWATDEVVWSVCSP